MSKKRQNRDNSSGVYQSLASMSERTDMYQNGRAAFCKSSPFAEKLKMYDLRHKYKSHNRS